MKWLTRRIWTILVAEDNGPTPVEYAVIVSLAAIVGMAAFRVLSRLH
jgi:Flp pilus assembly pilin Flp